MALITEVDVDLSHLVGGSGYGSPPARPDGLHVSAIIRKLEPIINPSLRSKRKDNALMSEEEERAARTRWEMGFAWEQVFEDVLAKRMFMRRNVVLQDPILLDGVWLSPDAMDIITWTLEEYKCTWKSSMKVSDLEGEFWAWFVQIKAYCYALKTFRARLFVFFVNGNYRDSGPQVRRFDLTFTPQELKSNWTMLLENKELVTI